MGAVRKHLLQELLNSYAFAQVHSFSRRPSGVIHPKLQEHTVDFEKLCDDLTEEATKFKDVNADAVFIARALKLVTALSFWSLLTPFP
jgi:hypothetical protein